MLKKTNKKYQNILIGGTLVLSGLLGTLAGTSIENERFDKESSGKDTSYLASTQISRSMILGGVGAFYLGFYLLKRKSY